MSAAKDAREAQLLAIAQADPVIQQLYKQWQSAPAYQIGRGQQASAAIQAIPKQIQERFKAIVAKAGGDPNYAIQLSRNGFTVDHQNVIERHPELVPAIVGGALTGGVLGLPALLGSGAAAGGGGGAAAGTGAAASTGLTAAGTGLGLGKIAQRALTAADIAKEIGGIAATTNVQRTADQTAQANYNIDYDKNALARYAAELSASQQQLERRKTSDDEYQQAISDRVYGSMLQNVQDVNIQAPAGIRVGQVSGGLRPSIIANRGQVGSDLEANAGERMQHPASLPDLPTAPELSATGLGSSGLDRFIDYASLIGGGAGTLEDLLKHLPRRTQPAAPPTTPYTPPSPSQWTGGANLYPGGNNPNAPTPPRYY